jgi:WD40 repeat protein
MDNTAKIWDLKGNIIADLKGHRGTVVSVAFSPDGQRIVTFSKDGTAKIWPGLNEIMNLLSKNSHREKLTLNALAEIPIKLSEEEFEKAVQGNIVEDNYQKYRRLIRKNKDQ